MALEENNNQEEKRLKNLEMIYRLESEDGKKVDIVLREMKNFKEFEKNIAKSYGEKNGVELVKLKDGNYVQIIYPSSPLHKEISKMVEDLKAGKKPTLSKELEELLFTPPKQKMDEVVDFTKFQEIPGNGKNNTRKAKESNIQNRRSLDSFSELHDKHIKSVMKKKNPRRLSF